MRTLLLTLLGMFPPRAQSFVRTLRHEWGHKTTPRTRTHERALPFVFACNEFGGYCIPRDLIHRRAAQAILRGEVWERETLQFMAKNCGAGDVVHAGTYYGDFLPALSSSLTPSALIWAFEPNRQSFRCAMMTVVINDLGNVKLHNAALEAKTESASYVSRDQDGRALGGGGYVIEHPAAGAENVAQISLDETVPVDRHVSILQLDVEGFEEEALRGASILLRRDRPILILETVPTSTWFLDQMAALGYQMTSQLDANSVFATIHRPQV
ncbi:MAG TPA: FkbM family methyltransferase [Methylocella sp.]|nr:FkbM family methyltransferase [Methylocella sp.]